MADRAGGLQLDDDVAFQRREWVVQRAGWAVLSTILLAARSSWRCSVMISPSPRPPWSSPP